MVNIYGVDDENDGSTWCVPPKTNKMLMHTRASCKITPGVCVFAFNVCAAFLLVLISHTVFVSCSLRNTCIMALLQMRETCAQHHNNRRASSATLLTLKLLLCVMLLAASCSAVFQTNKALPARWFLAPRPTWVLECNLFCSTPPLFYEVARLHLVDLVLHFTNRMKLCLQK